ncbi:hypothetical protein V1478_017073 [Vespula squamosa]|uniref:Uncharacterized protein n=1 Tax=Vespula squamosa TaxID=30214 RepID=A0ABD2A0Z5_VESSQ
MHSLQVITKRELKCNIGILHSRSVALRDDTIIASLINFIAIVRVAMNQCITEEDLYQLRCRPSLIFNQLRIIQPQFRPKSWTSVLESSQNILSNQDRVFLFKQNCKESGYSRVLIINEHKDIRDVQSLNYKRNYTSPFFRTRITGKILTRMTAGISVVSRDLIVIEMSEADGVDGGAFPVPECSNLHAVGPGSVVLAMYRYLNLIYNKLYNASTTGRMAAYFHTFPKSLLHLNPIRH